MATHRSREAFVSRCFAQRYEASQPAVVIGVQSPFKLRATTSESIMESTWTTRRAQVTSNELQH
eukprot:1195435-Prorocentrum_minimum.AAC.6